MAFYKSNGGYLHVDAPNDKQHHNHNPNTPHADDMTNGAQQQSKPDRQDQRKDYPPYAPSPGFGLMLFGFLVSHIGLHDGL